MQNDNVPESEHFTLKPLVDGVYACIHKPKGAAYSNAGIIDLGDHTLLVDAFDTLVAARDLRQTAEALFDRPVGTIVLTHGHSDHWIGASAFDASSTTLLASKKTRQVCLEWGTQIMKEFRDAAGWRKRLKRAEEQLRIERDERVCIGLENAITRARYVMAEMAEFKPRYADQTFEDRVTLQGRKRNTVLRSLGRGHSEDDAVLLLPQEEIAFVGDIGFFDAQPFLGFCDFNLYRKQLLILKDSDFQTLVPGHGPVGGKDDITLQLKYFDVMEDLVGKVVQKRGSLEEALQITPPEPFDKWLIGGMARFEANVRCLFAHFGGQISEQD
jgi:cyclase